MYLNGKPAGHAFTIHILDQGSQLYIGGNHFTDQYFLGSIDEVRIWKSLRSEREIYENYFKEINPDQEGLVLYYKFNEMPIKNNKSENHVIFDETAKEHIGDFNGFSFEPDRSNYIDDSPVLRIDEFYPSIFIKKNAILIVSAVLIIVLFLGSLKLYSNVLNRRNKILKTLVDAKTHQLEASVRQKEILIQEIHHRVKNNLQFVIALIDFELKKSDLNTEATVPMENISRRLNAINLVHEMLYRNDDLEHVSANEYIHELVQRVRSINEEDSEDTEIKMNIDEILFDVNQCTAIGIIITELLANTYKYAFKGASNKMIQIDFKMDKANNQWEFTYKDNGVGFSGSINEQKNGVGIKQIDIFSRQLGGKYIFESNNGFSFELKIPIPQK